MAVSGQTLAWPGFEFEIPADWEIVRHVCDHAGGRFEFATRKGFQAELGWGPGKDTEPADAMRSFWSSASRGRNGAGAGPFRVRDAGVFRVGWPAPEAAQSCQAVHRLASLGLWLRWVFAPPDGDAFDRVWGPLLRSFRPNEGSVRRFAGFGLDVRVPADYALEDLAVLPANVAMRFESQRKARLTVRRLGLPELVLGGRPLETFYPLFLQGQRCEPGVAVPAHFRGCPAVRVPYAQRPEHRMEAFLGRAWADGEAWLWHAEAERRLYACEQIGPKGVERLPVGTVFTAAGGEGQHP